MSPACYVEGIASTGFPRVSGDEPPARRMPTVVVAVFPA